MFFSKQFIVVWLLRRPLFFEFWGSWSWKCFRGTDYQIEEKCIRYSLFWKGSCLCSQKDRGSDVWRTCPLSKWKTNPEKGFILGYFGSYYTCYPIFTVTPSAECFFLCTFLIHTNDELCLMLQNYFPQFEERGKKALLPASFASYYLSQLHGAYV